MASLASLSWMEGAGSFLQAFGLLQSGKSARIAGERARVASEFNKRQADREALLAVAAGQRQMIEERRQANLVASRALAVASASGAGVSDPTIVNLIAKAKGEGAYRAGVALYEGEARARELRLQGLAGLASGYDTEADAINRQMGATLSAGGAAAKGAFSLYAKYGLNGPGTGAGSGDSSLIFDAGSTPLGNLA